MTQFVPDEKLKDKRRPILEVAKIRKASAETLRNNKHSGASASGLCWKGILDGIAK